MYLNVAFFHTQAGFKKPQDFGFLMKLATPIVEDIMRVKQKDFKSPPHHMQTLIDGSSCLNWIFARGDDEVKDWASTTLDQVRFYGNKVLAMGREKDTKWFEAYLDLMQSAIDFIVKRAESICDWTGKAEGAQAFFESIAARVMTGDLAVGGSASTPQAT